MSRSIDVRAAVPRIIRLVLIVQLVALAGNYVFNFFDVFDHISIRRIFNIAREESFPTWVASGQALFVGLTALALRRVTGERGWSWVAGFFIYVSIDDAAEVHERLGTALGDRFPGLVEAWPSFSWQLLIAPVLAAGLFAVAVYLWMKAPDRRVLVVAGLAAFGVAQGIDLLEGIDGLFAGWAEDLGVEEYTVGHNFRATEEMLEMLGTLALWTPMLWLFADRVESVTLEPTGAR